MRKRSGFRIAQERLAPERFTPLGGIVLLRVMYALERSQPLQSTPGFASARGSTGHLLAFAAMVTIDSPNPSVLALAPTVPGGAALYDCANPGSSPRVANAMTNTAMVDRMTGAGGSKYRGYKVS